MITAKTMTRDERVSRVQKLIEQFSQDKKFFLSKDFVEAECRSKFIDPLLECLGWDVKNEKGARHDRQEVITEDRVVIDGATKHPDYTLCYGGERKFYVEAKQPSVNLKTDPEPARQVRRYAYTSKMPIAVLTDFQELAIYDTRIKPKATDGAEVARIDYYSYEEYAEKFDELYDKISWAAVDLGKYDSYYEGTKDKRGTAGVDDDILAMIEDWRVQLSEDIALRNGDTIDEFNLTSVVQKIIDRILFLRIAEDKEIEERDTLKKIADGKTEIYSQLKILFATANDKFNAGLFATDKFLDSLIVSDKSLKAIITALYYPVCQYEFSVLPVEILGSIYERFLGKTIRFSRKTKNGHSVQVVEKPEVQKAGGVYYTPSYIVRYIVEQTLGQKLLEAATPENAASLKVCDPACGSGSFLVGAYQFLLDWHLDYYDTDAHRAAAEKSGAIYKDARSHEYKLSVAEKRRILINSIYGVDIDAQAVEVTKLSLFLKLLENEGKALSSTGQGALFRASDTQKILPDLGGNIKCGNSLVGSDYYADKDMTLFGIEEQRKVNVFDWEKAFPQIFADGGFDCVIGNPPYVSVELMSDDAKEYYRSHYPCFYKRSDLFSLFVYKGIKQISNDDARIAFIVPSVVHTNLSYKPLRDLMLTNNWLCGVCYTGGRVFKGVTVDTTILVCDKSGTESIYLTDATDFENQTTSQVPSGYFAKFQNIISVSSEKGNDTIAEKLLDEKLPSLDTYYTVFQGIVTGNNSAFIFENEKEALEKGIEKELLHPMCHGRDIGRYEVRSRERIILYVDGNTNLKKFPGAFKWLSQFKDVLKERREAKKGTIEWYGLQWPRVKSELDLKEKILMQNTRNESLKTRIVATLDNEAVYATQGINFIIPKDNAPSLLFLLAILNSSAMNYLFATKFLNLAIKAEYVKQLKLPIPLPPSMENNPHTEAQSAHTDETKNICVNLRSSVDKNSSNYAANLAALAEQRMASAQQLSNAKSDADRQMLQQRCDILDSQINAAVYKLYGLTAEEIEIIEKSSN